MGSKSLVANPDSLFERLKMYETAGMTHAVFSFVLASAGRRSPKLFARHLRSAFGLGTVANPPQQRGPCPR